MALHRDRQQQLQYASILPSTLLVLALLACGETPQQPAAASPPIPPPRLLVEVAENDDGWDYYNADVTIIREAGYNGAGMYTPESQSAYNIEQRLQLGTWNMRVQAAAHDPTGDGTMAPGEVDASRVETDDNVAYLRLFDRNGSALTTTPPPMQSYVGNPLPPYGDTVPAFPSPPPGGTPQRTGSSPAGGPLLSRVGSVASTSQPAANGVGAARGRRGRDWLDEIVVTPRGRARLLARLTTGFGPRVGRLGRLDRYVRRRGAHVVEHLLDPEIGAVVEENIAEGGRLLLHVTRQYDRLDANRHVLRAVRFELATGAGDEHQAIVYRLDNIRIEARGGQ